jgi:predicted nucleotidyltransferase
MVAGVSVPSNLDTELATLEFVVAGFVTGSHAHDDADEFSDIDLMVVVEDDAVDLTIETAKTILDRPAGRLVDFASRSIGSSRLANAVLADADRIDLVVLPRSAVATTPRWGSTIRLFDKDGVEALLPPPSPPVRLARDDAFVLELVKGVLRTVLLLPMLLHREEYLRGSQHVQLLKQDLIELLLHRAGNPPLKRPGSWAWSDLNNRLPAADRSLIEALPETAPNRVAVATGHSTTASVILAVAKDLLVPWPLAAYEETTNVWLRKHGLDAIG